MELVIMLALLVGAMWFMSNRSRKQQQAANAFRDNLQPGQQVMTGSGLYATVVGVEGDTVTLETSPGVETRWFKPAIAKLVEPPVASDDLEGEGEADDDEYDYDDEAEYDDEADESADDEEYLDEPEADDEEAPADQPPVDDESPAEDDRRA